MKHLITTSLMAVVLGVGLAGCASDTRPNVAPVPEELPGRPALNSVPDDAVYVAVMAGGDGFNYDLLQGQRYYLVDIQADRVLHNGVAKQDGQLQVNEDGASLAGDEVWDGDSHQGVEQIGLFVSRDLQEL